MPDPLLTFLKYIFLALLYLFFLRVLRAVWVELREPKIVHEVAEQSVLAGAFPSAAAPQTATGAGAQTAAAARTATAAGAQIAAGAAQSATAAQSAGATTTVTPVGGRHLVVTSPPGSSGVSYPLTGEVTVGRAPGCRVSLPDDTFVSQVHARVFFRGDQWWVEDLGSTNGTYVNDGRVGAPVVVRSGDRLQFGQTVMELRP